MASKLNMKSKSDDDIHKLKYKEFINKCHAIAQKHEEYCEKHCFREYDWKTPHTNKCIEYRQLHHESFVKCDSILCIKMNEVQNVKPSYTLEEKKEIINNLTFYSSDDESEYDEYEF